MLIRDDGETWTAIGQPAHAWLAGQLVRAWDPMPAPSVVLAIEQHDIAWAALDHRPRLNAEAGRAASFYEVALEERLELWTRVVDRISAMDPYAAVLVSLHATNIHTRYGRAHPEAFLAAQRTDQDALLARLPGASREQAERDADLLFVIDAMSLAICGGRESTDLPPLDGRAMQVLAPPEAQLTVTPWPFAVDELRVGVHVRTLRERADDERSLHALLDAADWTWHEWVLRRQ